MSLLDFYKRQSVFTDPQQHGYLFDAVPADISFIKSMLHGLIFHFWDGKYYDYQIPFKRLFDIESRYVHTMLEKIVALDSSFLVENRILSNRLIGSCRDYAVLFCSILRHHGIPARARVGFSGYYYKDYNHDQVVLEYWNVSKKRWCTIDPRVTEANIERHQIEVDFDLLDVPQGKFISAGLAWQMVRKQPELASRFGGGDRSKTAGFWYIRDRLVQDIAALNGIEMQIWDLWGLMLENHDIEQDKNQLALCDYLAELTLNPDKNFDLLRSVYQSNISLTVPNKIVCLSPVYRKKEIHLTL